MRDWRDQVAQEAIRKSNGDPIYAIKLATKKYQSLIARDLDREELKYLNARVAAIFEEIKANILVNGN